MYNLNKKQKVILGILVSIVLFGVWYYVYAKEEEEILLSQEDLEIEESVKVNDTEENFHEFTGLIYDGAFSEHLTNTEKKGLTGDEIDEETAKRKAEEFIGKDKIQNTQNNGFVENGDIPVYRFQMTTNDNQTIGISISKKGGHVVLLNSMRIK